MTVNIVQSFLSHFRHGVGRQNRFETFMTLPRGVSSFGNYLDEEAQSFSLSTANRLLNGNGQVNIKCHTITFPQRSLRTYTHNQNSAPFEVPFTSAYDPVTFMFYSDERMDTRVFLENWQRTVVNNRSNTLNFYNEFVSDIDLWALDRMDRRVYGVRLFNAYPLAVGAMDFAYSNFDNLNTVPATFAYKRWERLNNSLSY